MYHEYFMSLALKEAQKAQRKGEVPVGAVIVKGGKVISRAHNLRESSKNALSHAEILAINKACSKLKSWRLVDCDIYVTLEPCPMCAGALIQARLRSLFFGAFDPKNGAVSSVDHILDNTAYNHVLPYEGGILRDDCSSILSLFFKKLRK